MEKGQPSWSDTEAESDSSSKKERGNPRRRPVTVPRSVFLASSEEEGGTRPDRTGFKAPVVQLFARRELPGLPPAVELPQNETELKKKKKRKKKAEAAVVEPSYDELATVIEFPKANQEDDEEHAD